MAPLAELSHAAFRDLVGEIGGCGLFYTEMLNARIVAGTSIAQDPYVKKGRRDRPLIAQLLGNEPDLIVRSIAKLTDLGFDGFDINMGCSMRKIRKRGWGAGLMDDPEQAARVVEAARKSTELPLLAKIRSGADHDPEKLLGFARLLVNCGLDGLVLHARSVEDGFKRPARWQEIRLLARELPIPVIGNGDVLSVEDASRMLSETGCAGMMIGRGALIRPWIFWEIANDAHWDFSALPGLFPRLAELVEESLPETLKAKRFAMNCGWLLRNYPFYHTITAKLRQGRDVAEMLQIIRVGINENSRPLLVRPFAGKI